MEPAHHLRFPTVPFRLHPQHHHHNQEKDSNDERIYDPAWIRTDPRKKDNFERL